MTVRRRAWIFFLASSFVNGLLLWHFHDRYFYPTDDGFYAHIAERLLNGAVLNLDVQDIHPGYIHLLHAAAFRLFGLDMVSLRYPLALAAFVLGCLTYALLQRRDVVLAAFGSVAITALGVIQFFDPTPNWYCLLFCVMLACWMTWLPAEHPTRLVGAGLLLGVLTLFRQLSGVWAAMGVIVLVLLEQSEHSRAGTGWFARGLLLIMLSALGWYLVVSPGTAIGGVLLVAIWPLAILSWMLVRVRTANGAAAAAVAKVAAGAALSALPLLLYHVAHGSVSPWARDTVLAGFTETQLPFFSGTGWYGLLPLAGSYEALSSFNPTKIVNGVYWVVLPLVSVANGWLILRHLHRARGAHDLALPILASFYALVSIYFEGPLYLYYGVGLSLMAVLWFGATSSSLTRITLASTTAGLSVVAVVFHAGQSRLRTSVEILEGRRLTSTWNLDGAGLDRCRLRLDQSDRSYYGGLVDVIRAGSPPDASILALPNDAELLFLAGRRNPFRFYNSALGIQTPEALADVMHEMSARPPALVAFRPADKYNTAASAQIMDLVRAHYVRIETRGGLEIYTALGQ